MDVDLTSEPVDQHEALGRAAGDQLVAEPAEQLDDAIRAVELGDEVEVVVLAGLPSEQRVDAPAAVDPHGDALPVETVEDFEEAGRVHRALG
jgi:hypothetical protein